MGLETVLAIWGLAQLLVFLGLGGYALNRALAEKDTAGALRALQHDHDATLIELKASRAANEVLRKAATNAGVDTGSILDAVRAEHERLLQPAGDEDRASSDSEEAPAASWSGHDRSGGLPDPPPGPRTRSGL